MVNGEANLEAKGTTQDKTEGKQVTLEGLNKDLLDYSSKHTSDETKKYWADKTTQLVKDGLITDLAIDWCKKNMKAADISGDGKLNAAELAQFDKYEQNAGNAFDNTFAKVLRQDDVMKAVTDGDDTYDEDNLEDYSEKQAERKAELAEQKNFRDQIGPLFQGNPPLMQFIDGASDDNDLNGLVVRNGMKRFIEDYNRATNYGMNEISGNTPYTAENAKFVQDILDGKNTALGDDEFKLSKIADKGGFNVENLSDKTELEQYKMIAEQFNKLQDQSKPESAESQTQPAVVKDGDQTTSITYPNGKKLEFAYNEKDASQIDKVVITDTNGNSTSLTRNEKNEFVSTDSSGKEVVLPMADPRFDTDGKFFYTDTRDNKIKVVPEDGSDSKTLEGTISYVDGNKTTITVDADHFPTKVAYADGKSVEFGYDATTGEIASYTDKDGKKWTADNHTWVDADCKEAPFRGVTVDTTGNVTVTNLDGTTETQGIDGTIAYGAAQKDELTKDVVVQAGQGFDAIARQVFTEQLERKPTASEVYALSELIAAANDNDRQYSNGQIHTGETLVIPDLQTLEAQAKAANKSLVEYAKETKAALLARKAEQEEHLETQAA